MANAQVEKLKALGLRHGEKAVVGLATLVCILLLVSAVMVPSTSLTATQVAADAKAADGNLARRQEPDDILKQLEAAGIKEVGFEKLVDSNSKNALVADTFKTGRPWVTPEPGAGLIRDMPELIAPTELVAYPGRGGALVFDLDANGKRKPEDPDSKGIDEGTKARRKRKRRRGMGGMMGMMGGMGGMMGMMGGSMGAGGEETEEAKKERQRKEKQLKGMLAGKEKATTEKAKGKDAGKAGDEIEEPELTGGKEITKGLRWVALTGVLDHKKMRTNYENALKNTAAAPNYKQLDIQRQVRQSDGSWSDFEDVDIAKNHSISYNLPEEEEELTPDNVRIDALVDPLPFLKSGYWEKVHVVSLVPKEKKEIPKAVGGGMMGGMPGMMGGMMGEGMRGGKGMGGMMGGGMPGMMGGSMMGGGRMMGGKGMMGEGMMGGGGGSAADFADFQKTEEETIMIRGLDFTVEPDTTYRFRVRIVVFNPNYKHEDVSPGVDTESVELKGPWSETTEAVTMPADVTSYAFRKSPAAGGVKRGDQVLFQVTRWNPDSGVTVVRNFTAGPGEVIGEPVSSEIPTSDGTKSKSAVVDFNSHHIVLDTAGGPQQIASVGASGAPLDMPALALMLRPDGSVVLRKQASDIVDPVRKDMADNYKRELEESGKRRESSQGTMYGGMGGMMGMMGGKGGRGGR